MVTHQIGTVLKQALTTFSGKKELFYQNLEILKRLLEKTTAEDVNLDSRFKSDALWQRPNKAPITYIDIYEDNDVTMGIFILKSGTKLPLHNHPEMYGLIKVLFGKIKVTSYSLNTDKCKESGERAPGFHSNPAFDYHSKVFNVEYSGDMVADANSEICDLGPELRNLHEIESVGGPAAFLDILAPPYETIMTNNKVRRCCYYSILKEVAPEIFRLREIEQPGWYWTDTFPYTGPDLLDIQHQL